MLNILIFIHFPALLLIVCLLSWKRGASAERYGSLLILGANALAEVALAASFPHFPNTAMCAIDFVLACGLLIVALKFSSLWLGVAMLLQSIALFLQAFDFVSNGPTSLVHVIANNGISYAMLLCLIAGLIASWHKQKHDPHVFIKAIAH